MGTQACLSNGAAEGGRNARHSGSVRVRQARRCRQSYNARHAIHCCCAMRTPTAGAAGGPEAQRAARSSDAIPVCARCVRVVPSPTASLPLLLCALLWRRGDHCSSLRLPRETLGLCHPAHRLPRCLCCRRWLDEPSRQRRRRLRAHRSAPHRAMQVRHTAAAPPQPSPAHHACAAQCSRGARKQTHWSF